MKFTWLRRQLQSLCHSLGVHVCAGEGALTVPVISRFVSDSCNPFRVVVEDLVRKGLIKTVVQIGANDGSTIDPLAAILAKYELSGLLVEPNPAAAEKLRIKYANRTSISVNQVAIAEQDGSASLWVPNSRTEDGGEKNGLSLIASLNRNLTRQHVKNVDIPLLEVHVSTLTLQSLLKSVGWSSADLLVIDIEGMDDVVLLQLNPGLCPLVVQFEHTHISSVRLDAARRHLRSLGYSFIVSEYDCLCVAGRVLGEIDNNR